MPDASIAWRQYFSRRGFTFSLPRSFTFSLCGDVLVQEVLTVVEARPDWRYPALRLSLIFLPLSLASVLNSNSRLLSIIIPEFCQLIKIPSAAPPAQYAVRPLPPPYRCLVCRAWLEADELVNSNMEIYLMMLGVCTTPHWLLVTPHGVESVVANGMSLWQKPVLT